MERRVTVVAAPQLLEAAEAQARERGETIVAIAEAVVLAVYMDEGIDAPMRAAIEGAERAGVAVQYRRVDGDLRKAVATLREFAASRAPSTVGSKEA